MFFVCEVCKKSLSSSRNLAEHKKSFHSNPTELPEELQCNECDINFTVKNKYLVHMRNKHGIGLVNSDPMKVKKCPVDGCDFKHSNPGIFKGHYTRYHADISRIECSICDFTCWSDSGLSKHLKKVHTVSSEEEISWANIEDISTEMNNNDDSSSIAPSASNIASSFRSG